MKFSRIFNFVFREILLEFCKNSKLFRKTRNFDKIIFHFAKLEENFVKHEIKNFVATLLLHNLPSATYPPLLSARRFFNAARQCYFDMKRNKEPCFSILSSIFLWTNIYIYSRAVWQFWDADASTLFTIQCNA